MASDAPNRHLFIVPLPRTEPIKAMPSGAKSGWKTWRSRLGWRRWEAGPRNMAAPFESQRRCAAEFAPEDPGSARIHCCKTGVMRPGQNKRSRGRNGGGGLGGGGGGPHQHNRPRPPNRQQTFDSNGPSVKIRGNAYQVFERYVALAREAQTGGDRIAAENLYQHAEHYFRIMNAQGEGQGNAPPRPMTPADMEMSGGDGESGELEDVPAQGQNQSAAPPGDEPSPSY